MMQLKEGKAGSIAKGIDASKTHRRRQWYGVFCIFVRVYNMNEDGYFTKQCNNTHNIIKQYPLEGTVEPYSSWGAPRY